jgi:hypothetical protein
VGKGLARVSFGKRGVGGRLLRATSPCTLIEAGKRPPLISEVAQPLHSKSVELVKRTTHASDLVLFRPVEEIHVQMLLATKNTGEDLVYSIYEIDVLKSVLHKQAQKYILLWIIIIVSEDQICDVDTSKRVEEPDKFHL